MANKVPVGTAIGRAYGFAFGNIINNIGAIWIPMALLYAVGFFMQQSTMDAMTSMTAAGGDPQAMLRILPRLFGFILIAIVLITAAYAGLTREALGLRTGSAFLQNPFGGGTWRLLGAWILFGLVMLVIYIVCLILMLVVGGIGAVVAGGGSSGSGAAGALITLLFAFVIGCAMIYISTRLSFFLPPVVIAENRISLTQSWQLSQGNFWRIFAVLLVLIVPILVVEFIYVITVLGRDYFAGFHPGMSPEELQRLQQHQLEVSRQSMQNRNQYWYITYPIGFVVTAIIYGMFAGAAASAYRAVVPSDGTAEAEAMS